jgi:hypothetical protein
VGGGVSVVELHEAVGVGQDAAEVQPVEQVGAGLDVEGFAGGVPWACRITVQLRRFLEFVTI